MSNISSVLKNAKKNNISNLDAEILLSFILNVDRSYFIAHPEKILIEKEITQFEKFVEMCAAGMPVAYIIGFREFWSKQLVVTRNTLIPRPETECLVEKVLASGLPSDALVVDLGTGCGAIAISLAVERPNWQIHATDLSNNALLVAKQNAARLGITNITFHHGNWGQALPVELKFAAIVSNPPYLSVDDVHLTSLRFEPQDALVAGVDGLDAIKTIINSAKSYLLPCGKLFLEHGCQQGDDVRKILQYYGYTDIETSFDYSKLERVTVGMLL